MMKSPLPRNSEEIEMQRLMIGDRGDFLELEATRSAPDTAVRLDIRVAYGSLEKSHRFHACGSDPRDFLASIGDRYILGKILGLTALEACLDLTRDKLVSAARQMVDDGSIDAAEADARAEAIIEEAHFRTPEDGSADPAESVRLVIFAVASGYLPFEIASQCVGRRTSPLAESFMAEFWNPLREALKDFEIEILESAEASGLDLEMSW